MGTDARGSGLEIFEFSKTTFFFEISTFETRHRQNFVKIKKLISFGLKSLSLDVPAQTF